MKVTRFYDIQCAECSRWRSTDYHKGMDIRKESMLRDAELEGWGYKNRKGNLCPVCNGKMTLLQFMRLG